MLIEIFFFLTLICPSKNCLQLFYARECVNRMKMIKSDRRWSQRRDQSAVIDSGFDLFASFANALFTFPPTVSPLGTSLTSFRALLWRLAASLMVRTLHRMSIKVTQITITNIKTMRSANRRFWTCKQNKKKPQRFDHFSQKFHFYKIAKDKRQTKENNIYMFIWKSGKRFYATRFGLFGHHQSKVTFMIKLLHMRPNWEF